MCPAGHTQTTCCVCVCACDSYHCTCIKLVYKRCSQSGLTGCLAICIFNCICKCICICSCNNCAGMTLLLQYLLYPSLCPARATANNNSLACLQFIIGNTLEKLNKQLDMSEPKPRKTSRSVSLIIHILPASPPLFPPLPFSLSLLHFFRHAVKFVFSFCWRGCFCSCSCSMCIFISNTVSLTVHILCISIFSTEFVNGK